MDDLTKFTYVRFLSVIKSEILIEQLLELLSDAGFKPFSSGIKQGGILLVSRDILFSQKSLKSSDMDELALKEYQCLNQILKVKNIQAECLISTVLRKEIFNIPTRDVKNGGKTVCLDVYSELEHY
jgi:hypothetical protein